MKHSERTFKEFAYRIEKIKFRTGTICLCGFPRFAGTAEGGGRFNPTAAKKRYQGRLDANADEYIKLTAAAAERMQALINGLLDYSRIERKGNPFQPVDVNETVNSAVSNLRQRISETNAVITLDKMPTLDADKIQLIPAFSKSAQ